MKAFRGSLAGTGLLIALALPAAAQSTGSGELEAVGPVPVKEVPTNGLSSRLDQIASDFSDASVRRQARGVGLAPRGPGSLLRAGDRLVVQATADSVDAGLLDDLRAAGATILYPSREYGTVDIAVGEADLEAIGAVKGVSVVNELLAPMTNGTPGPRRQGPSCGSVTTEGDVQLGAAAARSTYGVDGTNLEVGVLSDSYNIAATAATGAGQDVSSGDLPGASNPCGFKKKVQVVDEGDPSFATDEGRAMLQLVHDLAPGARLAFATSGASEQAMAKNISDLADGGAKVIVDDITFFQEPLFQDGPVANAVRDATEAGVSYFSSAGNSNRILGGVNVNSFEAPAFREMPCGFGAARDCMDWNGAAGTDDCLQFTLPPMTSFRAVLGWAEPRNGISTDFDLFLFDVGGLVTSSIANNAATGLPFETIFVSNTTNANKPFCFAAERFSGTGTPRLKLLLPRAQSVATDYSPLPGGSPDILGPTIWGHNGTAEATTLAAVPYDNGATIEAFSSRGPVTLTHAPVSGSTPAAAFGAPQTVPAPNLTATDGGQTTFFNPAGGGIFRFFGTSAAAPHAAAVAALAYSRNASLTVAQTESALTSTADPIPTFNTNDQGAGVIDAVDALGSITAGPAPVDTECDDTQTALQKAKDKLKKLKQKKQTKSVKKKVKKQKKAVQKAEQKVKDVCG